MEFVGIIAEYDPFHSGHAAQLAMLRARGARCIAVCMSAGAVQRGAVPLLPEGVRVRAALLAGADLVVALPAPYACATAAQFAAAGVRLLSALGCDTLAFGAETPDAAALARAARLLDSPAFAAALRPHLDAGLTFAAARAAAAEELAPGTAALLRTPNNILAVEYCRAVSAQGAPMALLPLPRLGAGHGGAPDAGFASASWLRARAVGEWGAFVPPAALPLYRAAEADGLLVDGNKFGTALLALLRAAPPERFAAVRGASEGLDRRLAAAVRDARDAQELYARMKTKRYPHARLRRFALDAALGFGPELAPDVTPPPYLHVLGAQRTSLARLAGAALPAGTGLADLAKTGAAAQKIVELHSRAVDFSSLCRAKTGPMGLAFTAKPVLL